MLAGFSDSADSLESPSGVTGFARSDLGPQLPGAAQALRIHLLVIGTFLG